MMNIQEVSDILGVCWPLRMPKYILLTDERIHQGGTFFRGLQPKDRRDIIVLGADANATTIPHEAWHAQTGLGELTSSPIGEILARRYQRLSRIPTLKGLFSRTPKYREVSSSSEFPNISKYRGRVKLYTLVDG